MSDPIVETPSVVDAGISTPEPEAPQAAPASDPGTFGSAQEAHAMERLDRALVRAEGGATPPPSEPTHQPPPVRQAPQPPPPRQQPTQPVPLHLHPASQGFMGRINERAERIAQQRLLQRVETAFQQLPPEATAPGAPAPDPEPDFDADPQGWYRWENRQRDLRIQESLQPLADFVRGQSEATQQQHQRSVEQQQQAQFNDAMANEANYAQHLYAQTPEGALFGHRLEWFMNDVSTGGLAATGIHPQMAAEMANAGMRAWTDYALRHNINPALFIDRLISHQLSATAQVLEEAGWTPPQSGAPAAPRQSRQQTRQAAEIASLRETGNSASSVAGVVRNSTAAGPQGSGISTVLADPSVDNIRAFAQSEFGGDLKKANAAVRRAMAQAGGGWS